jgi:hypothetical protein
MASRRLSDLSSDLHSPGYEQSLQVSGAYHSEALKNEGLARCPSFSKIVAWRYLPRANFGTPTAKLSGPLRRTLPASCPLQCRIRHECRHRLPNRGIVGALQLVLPRQQEIDHLLTEFDLDRPQPQPPAFPRFANAFSCRSSRHSHRL